MFVNLAPDVHPCQQMSAFKLLKGDKMTALHKFYCFQTITNIFILLFSRYVTFRRSRFGATVSALGHLGTGVSAPTVSAPV